ncbi:MAG: type II toxin-antitoxin system RelE/ParE family toxin [Tepidisphaeraceae bacterium]
MAQVVKSAESIQDQLDIALFISRDSPESARRLLKQFDEALELLAEFPGLGAIRDELEAGLRSYPVGKYLLLYRQIEGGVELARVMHGNALS